ncbi:uncharacterized protein LOC126909049 isoform X2 [Daktulosphaira vitifoliae]|nr:uncharacterized protein LOC126909049 isoform X2 [Daktulosphaira vitifoliae]XP_050547368.1 uncharacterized protein LOC126909049 isoform X2 [Daktulosphaira vitifoliae]XP_050547369.1 uncharacterized protein LOC126909049 isoform X2 [Daktulosphaira vitifoliae]
MPDMPTYESFDNEENLHLNLDSIALKDCSNNQDNSIIVISQVNTENTHPPVFQSDNKVIDIGGSQNNEYHQIFHFFKEISEQYQSIQRTLDVIKIDIQDLQRQIEYQGVNKRSSESSLVEENLILPFSTLDELNDYESKLTDNNIYEKAMKRTLLKVGSSKLNSKTTYNVLRKVMTNEIAETFNVTGKGLKLSFNNYKMSKLIQETEYKTYLGQWLREASNRKNEKKNLIV